VTSIAKPFAKLVSLERFLEVMASSILGVLEIEIPEQSPLAQFLVIIWGIEWNEWKIGSSSWFM